MKKLGKKLVSSQETIEAYCFCYCTCSSCSCSCSCSPGPGVVDGQAYNSGLGSSNSSSATSAGTWNPTAAAR